MASLRIRAKAQPERTGPMTRQESEELAETLRTLRLMKEELDKRRQQAFERTKAFRTLVTDATLRQRVD